MEKTFNTQAQGSSLAQKRARLYPKFDAAQQPRKTMIEQQQPIPILKPHGMGEDAVDRAHYRQQLRKEDIAARSQQRQHLRADTQKTTSPRAITYGFNQIQPQKKQTQSWG